MTKNQQIERMLKKPSQWVDANGPYAEIVFSSRVRLARNLRNHRFTISATDDEKEQILKELKDGFAEIDFFNNGYVFDMKDLSALEKEFLAERHLISYDLRFENRPAGVIIDKDEKVSVMLNEEDHLRIQGFAGGLQLFEIYDHINLLDDDLGLRLEYAFDNEFGYLTSCPTNMGTGLRASALVHLPALVLTREIDKIIKKLHKTKILVRGLFGEGSQVKGNFFQLSSSSSLGRKEENIISLVTEILKEMVEKERSVREVLMKNAKSQVEDKIWRAYGVLKYAHLLSSDEVINLSSAIRLGVGLGIIRDITLKQINKLLMYLQPAHLKLLYNREMNDYERDTRRSLLVKEILNFDKKGQNNG